MTLWCSKSPFLYSKKPDIITSSAATLTLGPEIGVHNWNTHKSTPNKHMKQEWCETITEDLNYDLFGGPKWPGNWASRAHIRHTSKINSNWHVHQDQWKFFEKMTKDRNFDLFGGPTNWPLRPIFSTHIKVLGMGMWSNTVVKPVRSFWESDQTPEICFTLGPKMAQKLGR